MSDFASAQLDFGTLRGINRETLPAFPLMERMTVERGAAEDWELLHHLHYKTEGNAVGTKYWRLALEGETIGVLILAQPTPLLKERHKAMEWYKPGGDTHLSNVFRYKMVNEDFTVVSRLVLDTVFRGVGVSYRFQNLVARLSGKKYVEIQSAMSKYNRFAQRAGFRFVKPMRSNTFEQGVRFFRQHFDSHPADGVAIIEELDAMRPRLRAMTIEAMREFYYAKSQREKTGARQKFRTSRVEQMELSDLLKQLQQLVLGSPLYGIYRNPDAGLQISSPVPVLAFDDQSPTEPLKWRP